MGCYYYQQKSGSIVYAPFADAPKLPRHERPKCGAKTRKGTPCQAPPVWDKERDRPRNGRCKLHGGLSTGPKRKPRRRCKREAGPPINNDTSAPRSL